MHDVSGRPRGLGDHVRQGVGVLVWIYSAAIAAALVLLHTTGDRWWPSTFLLFGPRWLLVLPLLVLVPLALALRRRLLAPLMVALLLLVGPILGFRVPWQWERAPSGHPFRILTCNLSLEPAAADSIGALVKRLEPDAIALQEVKDGSFGWLAGWQVIREGDLLVASRHPLRLRHREMGTHAPHRWPRMEMLHCVVQTDGGDVSFCNVHLPSPRYGIMEALDRTTLIRPARRGTLMLETEIRSGASRRVAAWVAGIEGPVVIAGDFNLPEESAIYRRDWSRYADAFSRAGVGFGWTEWQTTRGVRFGMRIDHILMSPGWRPVRAWVEQSVGSDHLPLVTDVTRTEVRGDRAPGLDGRENGGRKP